MIEGKEEGKKKKKKKNAPERDQMTQMSTDTRQHKRYYRY